MDSVLHVSMRVRNPQHQAELFKELLDGEIIPTPLGQWGVVCVYTPAPRASWLMNMLEFWPPDKHWRLGELVHIDPDLQGSYCHVALLSHKAYEEMEPIAKRYGFVMRQEERGMPARVPVLYDDLGNYFEFFPKAYFPDVMNAREVETEHNRRVVTERFSAWSKGDRTPFFDSIAENVRWTVAGTCPGGGTWNSKETFLRESSGPMQAKLNGPMAPVLEEVLVDRDTVIVRWHGETQTKAGRPYRNCYCWVMRLRDDKIVEITSYLDSLAVAEVFHADPRT